MSKLDERTEQGIALASEMLGDTFGQRIREHIDSGTFASDLARFGMTHSYTDCWSREGLDRRSRSLVTIGALVGMRQPNELKNHIKAGVANGLTVKEIEEIILQLSSYVGFPVIATATTAIIEALREIGALTDAKTSEERGVL